MMRPYEIEYVNGHGRKSGLAVDLDDIRDIRDICSNHGYVSRSPKEYKRLGMLERLFFRDSPDEILDFKRTGWDFVIGRPQGLCNLMVSMEDGDDGIGPIRVVRAKLVAAWSKGGE